MYPGLNFTASGNSLAVPVVGDGYGPFTQTVGNSIETIQTEEFPVVQTGSQAPEASYNVTTLDPTAAPLFLTTQTLDITDLGKANAGAFVAISAYVNGLLVDGKSGITITAETTLGSTTGCSIEFDTQGDAVGSTPTQVLFGSGCIADTLSFTTTNELRAVGEVIQQFMPIRVSLDEFVVCRVNANSALAAPGPIG